ncbi:MAG: dihydrolipoyllysine-residue acetyltransferase [Saccharospirillum sp.]|nr:dihydrolipoyllysine-residue acetyltransferase [Saccharospirillum sp.]
MATEIIKVPDLGMDAASVIEVSVKEGDVIAEDDTLIVLESDKASMDVPAPMAGKITKIKVSEGDSLAEGDEILYLEVEGASGGDDKDDKKEESDSPAEDAPAKKETEPKDAEPKKEASSGSKVQQVKVPDIGMDSASIIEINVKPGDTIEEEDAIVVLESDKASMEVPSDVSGEVVSVSVKEGDTVSEGSVLIEVKTSGGGSTEASKEPEPEKQEAPAKADAKESKPKAASEPEAPSLAHAYDDAPVAPSKKVHAGPAVRKLAREFGVDLAYVPGSGPKGRIVKDDVAGWVKKRLQEPAKAAAGAGIPEIPDQDFSKFGEVDIQDLNRIAQITAQNMARNWLNIPHVTQFDEADVTETEAFRQSLKGEMEKRGVKISPLAFIVKACASALIEFPNFNVSLLADGKRRVQKHYVHIGVAVDTPNGLIVPVIRDADKKSIWQIAEEIIDYAKRGRDGKVKADEMKGGCFTVSSLGGLGGTAFTPIVNAPEVAILGVSKNQVKPHWNGKEFVPRTFTPLSLSYDHRAVNGADAAKFATYLCTVLADIRRLVL